MKTNALLYADETYAINRCIYDVLGLLVNFHGCPNVDIRRVCLSDMNEEGNVEDVATGQIAKIAIRMKSLQVVAPSAVISNET